MYLFDHGIMQVPPAQQGMDTSTDNTTTDMLCTLHNCSSGTPIEEHRFDGSIGQGPGQLAIQHYLATVLYVPRQNTTPLLCLAEQSAELGKMTPKTA